MIVSFILTLSKLYIWCKKGERCQLLLGLKELSNVQLDFVYLDYRNKCNNFKFNCFTFCSPCRDGFPVGQSGTLSKVYRLTPLLNNNRVWYKGCLLSYVMFIEITVYQYLDAKSFSNWRWEDGMISISLPPSISFLWPSLAPLVQIYFSPKPTAAVKIKDGSFNFHQQNTEHSFVKITRLCRHIDTN